MGIAESAARLLTKYGEPVVLSYSTARDVDGATGQVINPGTAVTVNAYGYPGRYHEKQVDGSSIMVGDIRLVLEKIATQPLVGWRATVNGKKYRVMDVQPLRKTAAAVAYICQLRLQ